MGRVIEPIERKEEHLGPHEEYFLNLVYYSTTCLSYFCTFIIC